MAQQQTRGSARERAGKFLLASRWFPYGGGMSRRHTVAPMVAEMDAAGLLAEDGWELAGWAGVDSGRLMLADPGYTAGMPAEFLASSCTEDGTASWAPYGTGIAVMVVTGWGDGLYPVHVRRDGEGRIIAMRADFTREARTAAENEEQET